MVLKYIFFYSAVAAVNSSPASVVVNDFPSHPASVFSSNWAEGWYAPCGDAYGATPGSLDYHTDLAGELGEVRVDITIPANLGSPECILVEEWHPGEAASCRSYLPHDAPLTLHLADGTTETVLIDQSRNPGQWNRVGHFQLRTAGPHATFSNNAGRLTCDASVCWWVADAWRFTEAPGACDDSASSTVPFATQSVEIPEAVSWSTCTDFGNELLALVSRCNGATQCSAPEFQRGHDCRADADAFEEKFGLVTARCLMSCMRDKRELRSLGLEVEAALGCAEVNTANEEAFASAAEDTAPNLRSTQHHHQHHQQQHDNRLEITQAAEAVAFDGDCSSFLDFALQVVEKCSGARCCADVVEDDACRYYAAGLHSLFPSNAINFCIDMLASNGHQHHGCTCFVRHVSACALQADVHEILYDEEWRPSCSHFPAMQHQQDPATFQNEHNSVILLLSAVAIFAFCIFCARLACAIRSASKTSDETVELGHLRTPTAEVVQDTATVSSEAEDAIEVKEGQTVHSHVVVVNGEPINGRECSNESSSFVNATVVVA